jgi:hypothetical protein
MDNRSESRTNKPLRYKPVQRSYFSAYISMHHLFIITASNNIITKNNALQKTLLNAENTEKKKNEFLVSLLNEPTTQPV